ncbi:MAG TPA: hypothetical protein VNZ86_14280 [Bacteroidia bacterium]|jgi:hypothetical protein|nr:hypothetical protein [Bacteroidia bacterium]
MDKRHIVHVYGIRIISLMLLVSYLFTSCSVQKRLYNPGYYRNVRTRSAPGKNAEEHNSNAQVVEVMHSKVVRTAGKAEQTDVSPALVEVSPVLDKPVQVIRTDRNKEQKETIFHPDPDTLVKVQQLRPYKNKRAREDAYAAIVFLVFGFVLFPLGIIGALYLCHSSIRENEQGEYLDRFAYRLAKAVRIAVFVVLLLLSVLLVFGIYFLVTHPAILFSGSFPVFKI